MLSPPDLSRGGCDGHRGGRDDDGLCGDDEPGIALDGDDGLRHLGRYRDGVRGLHGDLGCAHLRAGGDVEESVGAGARRRP